MLITYITVGLLLAVVVTTVIYSKTGKPQVNGLVWKEIGKDYSEFINIKSRAKEAVRWYVSDLEFEEKYPEAGSWRKPDINQTALIHDTFIPAHRDNEYYDEIQKLLDERGLGEKITIRAYLYPLESGNSISKAPHVHTIKLTYSTGSPDGTKEAGYRCTICDSRFLYSNRELSPEEVKGVEEENRKSLAAMRDLLDWTYGEGKYAEDKEKSDEG